MDLISKAGREWLARHGVLPTGVNLASIGVGRYGRYVSFASDPGRPKQRGFYRNILLEREGRWLLHTEVGMVVYMEHRNGHALLRLPRVTLPDVVLTALHRSNLPLQKIVELPDDAVIIAGAPTIIRGEVKRGATHLLLRVEREQLPEQERYRGPNTALSAAHTVV